MYVNIICIYIYIYMYVYVYIYIYYSLRRYLIDHPLTNYWMLSVPGVIRCIISHTVKYMRISPYMYLYIIKHKHIYIYIYTCMQPMYNPYTYIFIHTYTPT